MASAREEIFSRIKEALSHQGEVLPLPDMNKEVFNRPPVSPIEEYALGLETCKGTLVVSPTESQAMIAIAGFCKERGFSHLCIWEPELGKKAAEAGIAFKADDDLLYEVEASLTTVECLVARTGSFMVSSRQYGGRRLTVYPPIHMVLAYSSQIVSDIPDGFKLMKTKYPGSQFPSMVSLVTGASRTADIEKTLVLGAHGPKELIVFLVDDAGNQDR